MGKRCHSQYHCVLVLFLAAAMISRTLLADAVDFASMTPHELVSELKSRVQRGDEAGSRGIGLELVKRGAEALPHIGEQLDDTNEDFVVCLIRALEGIGGDESTKLLFTCMLRKDSARVAGRAEGALENRFIRFRLSGEEVDFLSDKLMKTHILKAGHLSRIVSMTLPEERKRFQRPVIARLLRELESPTKLYPIMCVYLSPEVYSLNQFLLAFSNFGEPVAAELRTEIEQCTVDKTRKWLILASGMCGDKTHARQIEEIARTDTDRYVRCVAIRSCARALQEGAIPFLESFLGDCTESEYGCPASVENGQPPFVRCVCGILQQHRRLP
jgi:hypothetical protein